MKLLINKEIYLLCVLILSLMYLPIDTGGLLSILTVIGLVSSLIVMNKDTRAMVLILLCGPLAGTLVLVYSLPVPGYITAVLIGLALARKYLYGLGKQTRVLFWFFMILMVFLIWFLLGPQHAYSKDKILYIFVIGTVSLVGWYLYLSSDEIDVQSVVTFCLLSGLLYLSIAFDIFHFPRPSSLVDFDFFRTTFVQMREENLPFTYHNIGISAMIAVSFLLSKQSLSEVFDTKSLVLIMLCIWVALMSQARQAIFGIGALFVIRMLLDNEFPLRKKLFMAIFTAVVGLVFITSIKSDAMQSSLNASNSTGFFNRDYSGMLQKSRDYIFGSGLGGYSIDGKRAYPHNIVLEILFELGIIGSLLIYIPLFAPYFNGRKFPMTTTNQYALLPVFAFGIRAMASGDLTGSIEFVSAMTILAYYVNINKQLRE